MKFLKWLLIAVLSLVVLFFAVALFLPSEYHVEHSIVIAAPAEKVYAQVADFNNWLLWMPWYDMEPTAEYTITDPGMGVGAKMSWTGDTVGSGSMTILEANPPSTIKSKLVFGEEDAVSDQIWTFETVPEGTRVVWAIEGEAAYPLWRYMGLMFDGMVGSDFERGLEKLKKHVEGLPDSPAAEKDNTDIPADTVEQIPSDLK